MFVIFQTRICAGCLRFLYVWIAVGNSVIKQVWSIFHWLVLPLKPEPGFLSAYVSWSSCVQWFEVRGNCSCYWYCWNGWSSLFKLSLSYLILFFTKRVTCIINLFILLPSLSTTTLFLIDNNDYCVKQTEKHIELLQMSITSTFDNVKTPN
jgi:hypothetical protein